MTGTLSTLGKKMQTILCRMRRHEEKLVRKLEHAEEAAGKQLETLDLAYSRALSVLTMRRKELARVIDSQLWRDTEIMDQMRTSNEGRLRGLADVSGLLTKLVEKAGTLELEQYSETVERASVCLRDSETFLFTKRQLIPEDLQVFEQDISIEDRSEMRPGKFVSKKSGAEKDLHPTTRAQSTAHKHRRQIVPQVGKDFNRSGNVARKLANVLAAETTPCEELYNTASRSEPIGPTGGRTHRNGTVSPKRDERDSCWIVSPTGSESTAAENSLGATMLLAGCTPKQENEAAGREEPGRRAGVQTKRDHGMRKALNNTQLARISAANEVI